MPELSRFYGIIIRMFFKDHFPSHFHAFYQDCEAIISIEDGSVIKGKLPQRAQAMVEEWRKLHVSELKENWDLGRKPEPMYPIKPLD